MLYSVYKEQNDLDRDQEMHRLHLFLNITKRGTRSMVGNCVMVPIAIYLISGLKEYRSRSRSAVYKDTIE